LELFWNASLVVKLVLMVLIYFSVVSWGIILLKFLVVQRATRDTQGFLSLFWDKKRFDAIYQGLKEYESSPLTTLFREGYQEIRKDQRDRSEHEQRLEFEGRSEALTRVLRRATTQETQRLEKYLAFLATTGSTAPFIGLFGTVWGIMEAFHGIGQSGSASLAVVAAPISEALVATAIGLVAAIPAVMGYNHFVNKTRILINDMDNFAQEFLNIAERMLRRS